LQVFPAAITSRFGALRTEKERLARIGDTNFGRTGLMKHSSTTIVYDYWNRLRGDRAAPERGEIEPGEIRDALADAFVLEIDNGRISFRLAGTRVAALFGRELKGLELEGVWFEPDGSPDLMRLIETVMNETAGCVAGFIGETEEMERVHLEMLLLPLRHRGKTHARIMGVLSPVFTPGWLGLQSVRRMRMISVRMIWPAGRLRSLANAAARRAGFIVHNGGQSQI
jgi:hypothetical protein